MNVNLEYYKIFYYVARYCNFTKAAHALHNSQPNITRAMNALEQEIQCTLFVRTNRGVQLTPEGQQLYVRVSAAMTQLQAAEDELTKSASLEYGSISIGASEIALNIYLLHRLRQFHIDYPKVRLKIANHSTPQAIQSLKSGEIDFAVVTTPLTVTSPLIQVNLQPFQDILVGGTTFRPLQQKILSISELKNYPFICLGVNTATRHFYDELFFSHGLRLVPDIETATTDQILPLVKNELGLAFLPEPMVTDALQNNSVVSLKLREALPTRQVSIVYDQTHPMSMAAHRLLELLIHDKI